MELDRPTVPRVAPASPISAPIKAVDPEVERMKAEFEARRDKIDCDLAKKALAEFESKRDLRLSEPRAKK